MRVRAHVHAHTPGARKASVPCLHFQSVAVRMWLPVGRAQVRRARAAQPLVLAWMRACVRFEEKRQQIERNKLEVGKKLQELV